MQPGEGHELAVLLRASPGMGYICILCESLILGQPVEFCEVEPWRVIGDSILREISGVHTGEPQPVPTGVSCERTGSPTEPPSMMSLPQTEQSWLWALMTTNKINHFPCWAWHGGHEFNPCRRQRQEDLCAQSTQ